MTKRCFSYIVVALGAIFLAESCSESLDFVPAASVRESILPEKVWAQVDAGAVPGAESSAKIGTNPGTEPGSATRTFIDQALNPAIRWNGGDMIAVFVSSEPATYVFDGQDGDASGSFSLVQNPSGKTSSSTSGSPSITPLTSFYAVYPSSSAISAAEGAGLRVRFPETQNYAPNSFGRGAALMASISEISEISETPDFRFRNLPGFLKLKLWSKDAAVVTSVTLKSNGGETLSGDATVTFTQDGIPQTTMTGTGRNSITIDCAEGVEISRSETDPTIFWLAIPPLTMARGFTVEARTDDGRIASRSTSKSISISRNIINTMAPMECLWTPDLASGEELDVSEYSKTIDIVWSGTSATVTNNSGLPVAQDGGHITIGTPTSAGKKVRINLSGNSSDGSLKIYNGVKANDTNKKMLISMNGVRLASTRGPVLNIQSGKDVNILLSDGTESYFQDASEYSNLVEGEDSKGCIFSEKKLIFSGSGKLSVSARCKHAICADDAILVQGGTIAVTKAVEDGIHAKDFYCQEGGSVTVSCSGFKCDAIDAGTNLIIGGGTLKVTSSGVAGRGLKCDGGVIVRGGDLNLMTTGSAYYEASENDTKSATCIKTDGDVRLVGGTIVCKSTGVGGKCINCGSFYLGGSCRLNARTEGGLYTYNSQMSRPKAIKALDGATIDGGKLEIATLGEQGEGLESKTWVVVNDGTLEIDTKDDGINAEESVTFNGGRTYIRSVSHDGIDSNYERPNSIVFNDGIVVSHSAFGREEAFDAANHAYLSFNGGIVIGTGGLEQAVADPICSQSTLLVSTAIASGWNCILDESGSLLVGFNVPMWSSIGYYLVSMPMAPGKKYSLVRADYPPVGTVSSFGDHCVFGGTVSGILPLFDFEGSGGYQYLIRHSRY